MSSEIFSKVNQIKEEIVNAKVSSTEELEQFRIKYLGSKNILKPLFGEIKNIDNDRKKEFGQLVNEVKQIAESQFQQVKETLDNSSSENMKSSIDLTAPPSPKPLGSKHPISTTMNRIINIF